MSNAQRLYEEGFITYMRTDSSSLSDQAVQSISTEIKTLYGDKYLHVRKYATKNKNAQEAHEAIRPTSVSYTHLRAHETVLDLVCLLLLEKKNDM